jgi:hypothetical protein
MLGQSGDGREWRQSKEGEMLNSSSAGVEHREAASRGTGWLVLAASPSFAFMAWISKNAGPMALCSSSSGMLPIDSMSVMYLLMAFFHLSPWLKLVGRAMNKGD